MRKVVKAEKIVMEQSFMGSELQNLVLTNVLV